MSRKKDMQEESAPLEWRDYVAIVAASFETTLLPVLAIIAALIVLVLVLRL